MPWGFGFASAFIEALLHRGPWTVERGEDKGVWLLCEGQRVVARVGSLEDAARISYVMNGETAERMLLEQVQRDSERIQAMTNAIDIAGFRIVEKWPVLQIEKKPE